MPVLTVMPHSDDVVELEILDDSGKTLFSDEIRPGTELKINDHFTIVLNFERGWSIKVMDVNEAEFKDNTEFSSVYDLNLIPNSGVYGLGLSIKTNSPISIEGIYGDQIAKLKSILNDYVDYSDIDSLIAELKKNQFI